MSNDAYDRLPASQFAKAKPKKKVISEETRKARKEGKKRRLLAKKIAKLGYGCNDGVWRRTVDIKHRGNAPHEWAADSVAGSQKKGDWYRKQSLGYAQRPCATPSELAAKKAEDAQAEWRRRIYHETELAKRLYQKYLETPHWKMFSAQIISARGFKCENKRCPCINRRGRLQVHHLRYTNLGHERPEDVQVLCQACHLATHWRSNAPEISHKHLSQLMELAK